MKAFIASFFIALAVTVLIALFWPVPASAQVFPCGDRADFVKTLADKYQESGRALGLANQINLVEIFTSAKGTWTIMVTQLSGKTCIIAAGMAWQELPVQVPGLPL